jgi:uncharacterized membrane protein YtjA (UPF0391 family)
MGSMGYSPHIRAASGNHKGLVASDYLWGTYPIGVPLIRAYLGRIKGLFMLQYPATFLIMAVVAGFLGFGSLAGTVAEIAQVLFFISLGIFLLSFIFNGRSSRD